MVTHDEVVSAIEDKLKQSKSMSILRLDKRCIPDLIAILKDNRVIAVEIEMTSAGVLDVVKQPEKYSDYHNVLIFTPAKLKRVKRWDKQFYDRIIELEREGKSIAEMRKELQTTYRRRVPPTTIRSFLAGVRNPTYRKERLQYFIDYHSKKSENKQ